MSILSLGQATGMNCWRSNRPAKAYASSVGKFGTFGNANARPRLR